MKYNLTDLYILHEIYYPSIILPKHRVESLGFGVVERCQDLKIKSDVLDTCKKFKYIPPSFYAPKPINKIVMCLELVNKYISKYPKKVADLFVKSLIVHEALHAKIHYEGRDYWEEEEQVHKLMWRNYFFMNLVSEALLIGGLKRYIKYYLLLSYCIITGKKRKSL